MSSPPLPTRMMLKLLQKSLDALVVKIDSLKRAVEENDKKFEACATGFYQVRDACTVLREELAEARGTMVEDTWNA